MTFAAIEKHAFRVWRYKRMLALLSSSVTAGLTVATLLLPSLSFAAFSAGTGIARVPNLTSSDQGYGIALQSDGKIV
ncbi:MAG TPA: hypothetical protein PLJ65_02740, partial [Casimicrobium sp.]|nr:hypothetical protein [Casimicrobium sp.]